MPSRPSSEPRTERVLRVVHDFAVELLEARNLAELLDDVTAGAISRLGYEHCVVNLIDEEDGVVRPYAYRRGPDPCLSREEFPPTMRIGQGVVGTVAATGRPMLVADVRQAACYVAHDATTRSEMAVPIVHDGVVLGVLDSESSEPDAFGEEDLEIFRTLASMLATRIVVERERAAHEADLRRESERALAADRVKTEFLANISHEVRTPLVAVLGVTEMLHGLVEGGAPKEVVLDHLGVVDRSSRHLLSLINQLLDLASDEQGRLRVQPEATPLQSLLGELETLFQRRAGEAGLTLAVRTAGVLPDDFVTDRTRLRQILTNLLDNAIKFTDGGSIQVEASVAGQAGADGRRVAFRVVDTGIGIAADERERVFESFFQADASTARQHEGVGLGLAISRRLARLLGGDLRVEEHDGRGAAFLLEVPELEAGDDDLLSGPDAGVRGPVDVELPPMRLLLAEDHPDSRRLMVYRLREAGHTVDAVSSGASALERFDAADAGYDAVLLDVQMPQLDGFAVVRALRERGYARPVFALTAHASPQDRERCLEAGFSDYLAKPFSWTELLRRLAAARAE